MVQTVPAMEMSQKHVQALSSLCSGPHVPSASITYGANFPCLLPHDHLVWTGARLPLAESFAGSTFMTCVRFVAECCGVAWSTVEFLHNCGQWQNAKDIQHQKKSWRLCSNIWKEPQKQHNLHFFFVLKGHPPCWGGRGLRRLESVGKHPENVEGYARRVSCTLHGLQQQCQQSAEMTLDLAKQMYEDVLADVLEWQCKEHVLFYVFYDTDFNFTLLRCFLTRWLSLLWLCWHLT